MKRDMVEMESNPMKIEDLTPKGLKYRSKPGRGVEDFVFSFIFEENNYKFLDRRRLS